MRDILVIRPQIRDRWSIDHAGLGDRFRVRYAGSDLDPSRPFDAIGYLDQIARIPADGVVATHDNAALLAALVAQRRGLPGPTPEAVFTCQYKPASRARQRAAAPGAVPRYAILDPSVVFELPFFVKPVFGTLSGEARRIDGMRQLVLLDGNNHARCYARVAEIMGLTVADACGYLVEELLSGDEVTLEGYVLRGRLTTIGITDSVKYAGTNSFERFEYPSQLPEDRRSELIDTAERLVTELGFNGGMLNIEFFVSERGPARSLRSTRASPRSTRRSSRRYTAGPHTRSCSRSPAARIHAGTRSSQRAPRSATACGRSAMPSLNGYRSRSTASKSSLNPVCGCPSRDRMIPTATAWQSFTRPVKPKARHSYAAMSAPARWTSGSYRAAPKCGDLTSRTGHHSGPCDRSCTGSCAGCSV